MKISRTIVVMILWLLSFAAKQFFGIDIPIVDPTDPEGDGFTIMELLNVVLPMLAVFFRIKATQTVNKFGFKTTDSLTG